MSKAKPTSASISTDNPGTVHLPSHFVKVWLEGEALCIRLPDSNTLMLPTNRYRQGVNIGFAYFIDLLRERARGVGTIGMDSVPVQYDVEKALRDYGKPIKKIKPKTEFTDTQRAKARDILRRRGIT